jgi:hypothetical protein
MPRQEEEKNKEKQCNAPFILGFLPFFPLLLLAFLAPWRFIVAAGRDG